jgi:hypothetical protein
VAATPSRRVTDEEAALRQIKVRITDITERKALWTTGNNIILRKVVQEIKGAGVVGVKKLPSGDIAIQLKEREDKLALGQRSAWLKGVSPSARVIADLYPVLVYGVRIKNVNTIDQGGLLSP